MQVDSGLGIRADAYERRDSAGQSRRQLQPRVSIVILNWNGWADTVQCLRSLYAIEYDNYCIVIVDNASTDSSIPKIREYIESELVLYHSGTPHKIMDLGEDEAGSVNEVEGIGREFQCLSPFDKGIILIRNNANLGFAGGNNVGIKFALKALDPKYVLLLNNDTTVEKLFLKELADAMEADEKIGSVQSILLRPGGEIIDSLGQEMLKWGARDTGFGLPYVEGSLKGMQEIFGPCAAAALYRSDVLREIGLFDDDFFVIYEDVDLSWRIRLRGYSSFLVPSSVVYHKRGISSGRQAKGRDMAKFYYSKNWWMIAVRYYPLLALISMPKVASRQALRCIFEAWKLGKVRETLDQMRRSFSIHKNLAKECPYALKEVQSKWILMRLPRSRAL